MFDGVVDWVVDWSFHFYLEVILHVEKDRPMHSTHLEMFKREFIRIQNRSNWNLESDSSSELAFGRMTSFVAIPKIKRKSKNEGLLFSWTNVQTDCSFFGGPHHRNLDETRKISFERRTDRFNQPRAQGTGPFNRTTGSGRGGWVKKVQQRLLSWLMLQYKVI